MRLIIILVTICVCAVFAQEKTKEKKERAEIRINGLLEAGIDINNKLNNKETDYNPIGVGKIDISARPAKKELRAEFGFEYDMEDSVVTVDKLYGQYEFSDFGTVRIGRMKKAFGLEEKAGVDERYFHKSSIINDRLEELRFLDHDLTFQYRHDINKDWRIIGAFAWQSKERYYQNYSIEYNTKKTDVILAAIIRHFKPKDENLSTTFITSLSFKHAAKALVSEAELTFGLNPAIKVLEERNFYVYGARLQEYYPINIETKTLKQIIPVAEANFYSGETGDTDKRIYDLQLKAGLVFGFAQNSAFQWRNTYGTVLRTEDDERNLHRRRFDSEIVVIF